MELEGLYGSEHPFRPSFEDVNGVLDEFTQLTGQLGLDSPWDCQSVFSSTMLEEKLLILQPIVENLTDIMQLPRSTAKKPRINLVTCLNKVLKHFCGTMIRDKRHKIRIQGEKGFKDIYYYSAECPEQSTKTILEIALTYA